jgi:hypothetical protein
MRGGSGRRCGDSPRRADPADAGAADSGYFANSLARDSRITVTLI